MRDYMAGFLDAEGEEVSRLTITPSRTDIRQKGKGMKKKYKRLTSGMIINKETDEILHRGRWNPAKEYHFISERWSKHVKPMRREVKL